MANKDYQHRRILQTVWISTFLFICVSALVSWWLWVVLQSEGMLLILQGNTVKKESRVDWSKLPKNWPTPVNWSSVQEGFRLNIQLPAGKGSFVQNETIDLYLFIHNADDRTKKLPGSHKLPHLDLLWPQFWLDVWKGENQKKFIYIQSQNTKDKFGGEEGFDLLRGSVLTRRFALNKITAKMPIPPGAKTPVLTEFGEDNYRIQFIYIPDPEKPEKKIYSNVLKFSVKKGDS